MSTPQVRLHILTDDENWLDHASQEAAHRMNPRCPFPQKGRAHSMICRAAAKVIRAEIRKGMARAGISEEPK